MKTTPFMHARRKLRHVQRFQELKDHTTQELSWLEDAGVETNDVIGCYRSLATASPLQTLVVLEDQILYWHSGQMRSIAYQDIVSVSFNDGLDKSVDANGLAIHCVNGETCELIVDSGDDATGTRDSFMVKVFLENVADDCATSNDVVDANG